MNEFINRNPDNVIFTVLIALLLSTSLAFYISSKLYQQAMADKGYIEQALPSTATTIGVKENGRY